MKQLMKTLSCLALCATLGTTCFAATGKITYSGGDTGLVFSGKATEARAGQMVTVKVTDTATPTPNVVFIRQTTTDENGRYELVSEFTEMGDLVTSVAVEDETPIVENIFKSSAGEVAETIGRLNGGTSLASIVALAQASDATAVKDLKILRVNAGDFVVSNASGLLSAILTGKTYPTTSIEGFSNTYNKALFFVEIEDGSANGADLLNMMEGVDAQLVAPTPAKNAQAIFDAYSDAEKASVLEKLKNKRYTNDAAFFNGLYEAVIIKELNATSNYDEKFAVLENNEDYLDTFLTQTVEVYGSVAQFDAFKTALFGNTINSVATLDALCEAYYPTYSVPASSTEEEDDGNDGWGGGGSVSVGGGLIPKPDPMGENYFNDLKGYEWATESIHKLAEKGVINGKADKVFAPADNVTRAEFVKILVGALNLTADDKGISFTDIPAGHWAYDFVKIAASAGVVNGVSEGRYGANELITREDMAVMCYRALEYAGGNTAGNKVTTFNDANQISDYAKTAVDALSGMGIINGKGNGVFDPKNVATRAEAAKVIYSLLGRI